MKDEFPSQTMLNLCGFQARHHGLLSPSRHPWHSGIIKTIRVSPKLIVIIKLCVLKILSMQLAEDEDRETEDDLDEEDEEYDSGGSGVAMTPPGG